MLAFCLEHCRCQARLPSRLPSRPSRCRPPSYAALAPLPACPIQCLRCSLKPPCPATPQPEDRRQGQRRQGLQRALHRLAGWGFPPHDAVRRHLRCGASLFRRPFATQPNSSSHAPRLTRPPCPRPQLSAARDPPGASPCSLVSPRRRKATRNRCHDLSRANLFNHKISYQSLIRREDRSMIRLSNLTVQ